MKTCLHCQSTIDPIAEKNHRYCVQCGREIVEGQTYEFIEIEPGRVLDLLVAKEIFGIKCENHQVDSRLIPHFSTKPEDCYRLKCKMTKRYHWLIKSPFKLGDLWYAGLTPLNMSGFNGVPDFTASGKEEMEAVCKVALIMSRQNGG